MRYGRSNNLIRYGVPGLVLGLGAMMLIPGEASRDARPSTALSVGNSSYLAPDPNLIAEIDAALAPLRATAMEVAAREMELPDPSARTEPAPIAEPEIVATPETIDPAKAVRVGESARNMRVGPSTSPDRIATLSPGQDLMLIELESGWAHVRTAEGVEGWVYASYLSGSALDGQRAAPPPQRTAEIAPQVPVQEPVATPEERETDVQYARARSDTMLRAGPSRRAGELFLLPAGERVILAETNGRWGRVVLESGASGWLLLR